jgi:hypothetical protein
MISRRLNLTQNGWRQAVEPTPEQRELLSGDNEAATRERVRMAAAQDARTPDAELLAKAEAAQAAHTPEGAEVFGGSIFFPKGNGYLFCKIGEAYKQINF